MRNRLHIARTDIPSSQARTPLATHDVLHLIDEPVRLRAAQPKDFGTRKQVLTDRERAIFTDDEREIAPPGMAWLRYEIKRRSETEMVPLGDQGVIALMIIGGARQGMEGDAPEKLPAVLLAGDGPTTELPGEARIRTCMRILRSRLVGQEHGASTDHLAPLEASARHDAIEALDQQDILSVQVSHMMLRHTDAASRRQIEHRRLDAHFVEPVGVPIEFGEPERVVSRHGELRSRTTGGRTGAKRHGGLGLRAGQRGTAVELLNRL
nr:hypothetical protein [Steroidobacter gossypii]